MTTQAWRSVTVLTLGLLLPVATLAEAAGVNGFWQELGGSASGDGVSQSAGANASVVDTWAAIDPSGLPVVAYTEANEGAGR